MSFDFNDNYATSQTTIFSEKEIWFFHKNLIIAGNQKNKKNLRRAIPDNFTLENSILLESTKPITKSNM
jgi:hypothetical protein